MKKVDKKENRLKKVKKKNVKLFFLYEVPNNMLCLFLKKKLNSSLCITTHVKNSLHSLLNTLTLRFTLKTSSIFFSMK